MRILVFGGTTEGRILVQRLTELGHEVCVSVATKVGAEALGEVPGAKVLVGRRHAQGMAELVRGCDLCIDATHPYAEEASANVREACENEDIPLRRVTRDATDTSDCIVVSSAREAADLLASAEGIILVTTGSKELAEFEGIDPARLVARVLPTHEGLAACEHAGIPRRNVIAMHGPFSRDLNEALMRQYRVRWLVTKDGGRAGGTYEKLAAARRCGVRAVLISRPSEAGMSVNELLRTLKEEDR